MTRTSITKIATGVAALLCTVGTARAQNSNAPYPNMAPLDQYLMADRSAEIALARSAAPEAISRDAEVYVLGRRGYESAVNGKNGYVCIVERSWMTTSPGDREFWNPKQRLATCYNPPAARSTLPLTFKKTELVLSGGLSKAQITDRIKTAYAKKELPSVEPGGMVYMMSKHAYLTDDGDHDQSHVMFYLPHMGAPNWGANVSNTPVEVDEQTFGATRVDVVTVYVAEWSDGSPAPPTVATSP
jgi:hypothetical protein